MSMKCLPLKPHFYLVKLGYAGLNLFLLKNIDCGYSLELPQQERNLPQRCGSVEQKYEKYHFFSVEKFQFLS